MLKFFASFLPHFIVVRRPQLLPVCRNLELILNSNCSFLFHEVVTEFYALLDDFKIGLIATLQIKELNFTVDMVDVYVEHNDEVVTQHHAH